MSLLTVSNQAVRETSTTKKMSLGTPVMTPDGRTFRYAKAGASALVAGNLIVAANPIADHQNRLIDATVTAAIGDVKVQILSIGATAMTLDQYTDGYLVTIDGTGEGYNYVIDGHSAYDASATDVIIRLKESIIVALPSTAEVVLEYNPWANAVISATDQADLPVGVAHTAIPANGFGFIQTGGPCAVWGDETFVSGGALTIGTGVAGQVELLDAAGEPQVGIAMRTGIDGEHTLAYLTID